jgi:HEAT repeat protein
MLEAGLLEKVKTYDWGQSRAALTQVTDTIRKDCDNKDQTAENEKALLSILESDAGRAGKQFVCRQLSIIGTGQSVPALAKMLTDETYSDMARYALERIPDSSVDAALRNALPNAEGKPRIGIINSLGQRRDKQSVGALGELVSDSDEVVATAAVAALGNIADDEAMKVLAEARNKAQGKLQARVLDAYLLCADRLVADGKKAQALLIYKELQQEGMPKPIRTAALTGMLNAAKN